MSGERIDFTPAEIETLEEAARNAQKDHERTRTYYRLCRIRSRMRRPRRLNWNDRDAVAAYQRWRNAVKQVDDAEDDSKRDLGPLIPLFEECVPLGPEASLLVADLLRRYRIRLEAPPNRPTLPAYLTQGVRKLDDGEYLLRPMRC